MKPAPMNHPLFLLSLLFFSCLLFLVHPFPLRAADPGYKEITAPELKILLEKQQCLLIHSLSKIVFEIQHIEGSINIPVIELETTTLLPKDKSTPLVFYCMGKR
jgi:hypothetical protein